MVASFTKKESIYSKVNLISQIVFFGVLLRFIVVYPNQDVPLFKSSIKIDLPYIHMPLFQSYG